MYSPFVLGVWKMWRFSRFGVHASGSRGRGERFGTFGSQQVFVFQVNATIWLTCLLLSVWVWDSSGSRWPTAKWPPTSTQQVFPSTAADSWAFVKRNLVLKQSWNANISTSRCASVRPLGVLLISLALCADAAIGNVQEKAMKLHNGSNSEMVLDLSN